MIFSDITDNFNTTHGSYVAVMFYVDKIVNLIGSKLYA